MQMGENVHFVQLCNDVVMFFPIIELQKVIENKSACNMTSSRHYQNRQFVQKWTGKSQVKLTSFERRFCMVKCNVSLIKLYKDLLKDIFVKRNLVCYLKRYLRVRISEKLYGM